MARPKRKTLQVNNTSNYLISNISSGKKISSKKKTTITFVIDDEVLEVIRNDAENQGVSINNKINNILSKYAFFYRMIEVEKAPIIACRTLSFVIDNIDEEKWIEEYNSVILDLVPAHMIENKIMINIENIINLLFKQMLLYCGPYQGFSYYIDKEGLLNLVFRHDKTIKWSRILGKVYSNLLEKKLKYHTELELSQNSVIIKILEKNVLNI
jgi:hypothetical protein